MPKIPQILAKDIRKILIKRGFKERKTKGNHMVFVHSNNNRTVLPMHNKPIAKGTLRAILKQAGLSVDDLIK